MDRARKNIHESRVTLSALMGPQDANAHGNVHGGVIMKMVDEAGALVAMRHARMPVVTVAIDSMTFMEPILLGNLVMCNAELTYVGRSSMEVRVEVTAENPLLGQSKVTNSAYLVYVALGADGHPAAVPELIYETPEQQARAEQARQRQAYRKQQRDRENQEAI
ncbi:MAG: acyl-CoA thioesterase [Chloroflexi bacterium]|nr:acyl-CoA thioesterase [Chloroflexota bacterium]MDL1883964.1 acyl-CoA thioesterase [Anaerolineae bacterium CFX8]